MLTESTKPILNTNEIHTNPDLKKIPRNAVDEAWSKVRELTKGEELISTSDTKLDLRQGI